MSRSGGRTSTTGDGVASVAGSDISKSPGSASRLGPGREFDLIRRFVAGTGEPRRTSVRIGPGDDCAVLTADSIAVGTDLAVEDVHFRRDWLNAREIGYRATAAALSDLAAMAAEPIGVLASLAVASADADHFAESLMRGVVEAVEGVGGQLIGGDLTRSPGPIILDIVVVGSVHKPILRVGAAPGDELWVTGSLGAAALAVKHWRAGRTPRDGARNRFVRPEPRIREALWLSDRSVATAMLDVSDGVAGDAAHIAAASGVAIVLEADLVPVHPEVLASVGSTGEALDMALSGGEDYELLFTCRAGAVDPHGDEFRQLFGVELTRVGRVEEGSGVFLLEDGRERKAIDAAGFQHFGGSE